MLTFENVLEIFHEYLLHDPEEEVLPCKRGYVRLTWNKDSRYCVDGILCRIPEELFILKLGLKILAVPVVLALTLFTWLCFWLLYVSSFIFGLVSTVVALLGIAVLVTYSPQNGVILLVIAFLVSPLGLPMAAVWLVGKVQDLRYAIQDAVYG